MPTDRDPPRCSQEGAIVAWLQGEVSPGESERLGRHVAECDRCRAFAEDARRVIAALADGSPACPMRARPAAATPLRAALAAAALVLAGMAVALSLEAFASPAEGGAPDSAAWMAAALGEDGTWDPALWEGLRAHPVGVHALALRALILGGADPSAIARATTWLVARQAPDGSLGRPLAEGPFDHAVATTALLEAWGCTGRDDVRAAADRALTHLLGGEADDAQGSPPARLPRVTRDNAAHTAWLLRAVMRADELGWPGLQPAIADGRQRLALETGRLLDPGALRAVDIERVALEPRPPPVVASMGELLAASEDVLLRARR